MAIFGAIKDDNMKGKIRVSIVATSLNGSSFVQEPRPVFNIVGGSNERNKDLSKNLFSNSNIEQNVVNSIEGATALKLDENYEIKNSQEQNALIESFESKEESQIADEFQKSFTKSEEIPAGVSIESASYIENNSDIKSLENSLNLTTEPLVTDLNEGNTPKLFNDSNNQADKEANDTEDSATEEQLFDQDINEDEDFEIPAFLRRQKF